MDNHILVVSIYLLLSLLFATTLQNLGPTVSVMANLPSLRMALPMLISLIMYGTVCLYPHSPFLCFYNYKILVFVFLLLPYTSSQVCILKSFISTKKLDTFYLYSPVINILSYLFFFPSFPLLFTLFSSFSLQKKMA